MKSVLGLVGLASEAYDIANLICYSYCRETARKKYWCETSLRFIFSTTEISQITRQANGQAINKGMDEWTQKASSRPCTYLDPSSCLRPGPSAADLHSPLSCAFATGQASEIVYHWLCFHAGLDVIKTVWHSSFLSCLAAKIKIF